MPKPSTSPYHGLTPTEFVDRTRQLIDDYPIPPSDLVRVVLMSWDQVFESLIGGFRIGFDIFPGPQAMGGLLHELIPVNLGREFSGMWRRERNSTEKDIVCLADARYSTEIKTSSSQAQIFGNRSFAQETEAAGKKVKSGYYLGINFSKFPSELAPDVLYKPTIRIVRFGWLDHTDWTGQDKATGQQSALAPILEDSQLLTIFLE